jgi:integrase
VKRQPKSRKKRAAAGSGQQKLRNVGECLYRSASSKIYYGITYVGKRQVKKSLKTTDRQLAENQLAEFRAKVGNLKPDESAKLSFYLIGLRWLADHQHKLKARTIRGKTDSLKTLDGILGEKPIRSIDRDDISRWLDVRGSKVSGRTFNWELDIMRGVFGYAVKRGLILNDPTRDFERRRPQYRPVVIPTRDEFKALVAQLHKTYKHAEAGDFVEFLAYSGARQREAAQMTWDDVKFEMNDGQGVLNIGINPLPTGAANDDGIKTESSRRPVPMNPKLREFLLALKAKHRKQKPSDRLFSIASARKALQTACGKLWGKDKMNRFTHHDFRHLFATTCIEGGVDIPTVSRWLGHKDGGALCMKVYGHLREQHSAREALKVSFD